MDSSSIRLLIIDVDGTLIGENRTISPRVYNTLIEARQRGVQIALCTGRPMAAARRYADELQLSGYHIFDSGATIANPLTGSTLYQSVIDKHVLLELLRAAQKEKLYFELYTGNAFFVEEITDTTRMHIDLMGYRPTVGPLLDVIEKIPITKAEMIATNPDEHRRISTVLAAFADRIDLGWATAPGTSADFVNIMAKGISKGDAVLRLADHAAVPLEQRMGVGDGLNDEPMLRNVGIPVAMGDAPDAIKELAAWVTRPVEEDGLALAVERYILSNGHKQ